VSRNDDMITLGGGEIDEMELLVRKLKGAGSMVEELPVIDTEEDEKPADEPIEITIGGSDGADEADDEYEDYSDFDFSVDNYDEDVFDEDDSDEDDFDEDDSDEDESDEDDSDEDDFDEDDSDEDDSDEDDSDEDDSDEDDSDEDDSDEDDSDEDDSDEDDSDEDDSDEDDSDEDDSDEDDSDEDDSDEDDSDEDDSDEDDSDEDDSDEDDFDEDESDEDESDEDDYDEDESDEDDSDEDDFDEGDIVIGGTDEDDLDGDDSYEEYIDEDISEEDASDEGDIVVGGGDTSDEDIVVGGTEEEPETEAAESAAEPEETPREQSTRKKKAKAGGDKRNVNLPAPVIGPRDLDKVRAARAQARKLVEDASRNSDDQDFRKKFLISASPHLHCGETTKIVMQDVIIALMPALVMAFALYGWRSLMLTAVCVISCVLTEYICRRVMNRRQTISDCSAAVTGILLAFCLPPEFNPLFAVVGSIVAIVVVKQMFGGIGHNFANPAATARIVLTLSFPAAMTTFTPPFTWWNRELDAVTSATPLGDPEAFSLIDILIGNHGGCLGETCAIALLLGGAYLLVRKVISWHIPVTYIGTVAVMSLLFGLDPIAQICSGGLLLGAFFMATDYVTSPVNKRGQLVFGVGCGLLTIIIRRFGAMDEGVSFAILIMNILTPHIERITTPRPFGEEGKQA